MIVPPESSTHSPEATVILAVRKGHRAVLECLGHLMDQDFAEPFEVFVAMTEGDALADAIRTQFPSVVVGESVAHGPGGRRNHGIERAHGRYLLFTDADCLPRPDWLRRMIAAARRNPGMPVSGWVETGSASAVSLASEMMERGLPRPSRAVVVPGVWAGSMCLERALLLATGARFAEDVFGSEEMALLGGLPLDRQRVVMTPDAVVLHDHTYSIKHASRRMHQLGFGSAFVRSRFPLRGAFLARHRWAIPLLPVARHAILLHRIVSFSPRALWDYVRLFPLLCWFSVVYAVGFAAGARAVAAKGKVPP